MFRPIRMTTGARSSSIKLCGTLVIALRLILVLTFLNFSCARAALAQTNYLSEGYKLYKEQKYSAASQYLKYAVEKENAGASAWLYLAHSLYSIGKRDEAIAAYNKVVEKFPGSPEMAMASSCLKKLDPGDNFHKPKPEPTSASLSKDTGTTGKAADEILLSRIKIGFWKQDHPPITVGIVRLVKANIKELPDPVKEILVKGNIKFLICGTLVDKFPSLTNREGRGYEGHTYKRCGGMYFNKTLCICQNLMNEGNDMVESALPLNKVSETFYHELGHALDDCGKQYSLTDEYRISYWQDMARIPDDAAARLHYFMQKSTPGQKESCAEITAVILNGAPRNAEDIRTYFPLTMKYLRKKLNME